MSEDNQQEQLESLIPQMPDQPLTEVELKLQLLHLAKDIVQQNAAMRWETHKRCEDIGVDVVVKEARKLLKFVSK